MVGTWSLPLMKSPRMKSLPQVVYWRNYGGHGWPKTVFDKLYTHQQTDSHHHLLGPLTALRLRQNWSLVKSCQIIGCSC